MFLYQTRGKEQFCRVSRSEEKIGMGHLEVMRRPAKS